MVVVGTVMFVSEGGGCVVLVSEVAMLAVVGGGCALLVSEVAMLGSNMPRVCSV